MTTSHMTKLLVALVSMRNLCAFWEGELRWINCGSDCDPGLTRISGREVPLGA